MYHMSSYMMGVLQSERYEVKVKRFKNFCEEFIMVLKSAGVVIVVCEIL